MKRKFIQFSGLLVTCMAMVFATNVKSQASVIKGEQPVAGITISLDKYYETTKDQSNEVTETNTISRSYKTKAEKEAEEKAAEEEARKYQNIGIANVKTYVNIRSKASESSSIIGKLPKNAGCYIKASTPDGWLHIKSGSVDGYVKGEYLITGEEVPALAKKVGSKVATVNQTTVRIREKANQDCVTLTLVPKGEELKVVDNKNDEWVKVKIDNYTGYIYRDYVDVSFQLKKAVSNKEVTVNTATGVTSLRAQIVSFAKKYLGKPYVYGGTSLTNGIDCSAYVMKIYGHFGYSLPRTARPQAKCGTSIKASQAKPGDLVFYAKAGSITHVAMYIGNGQIIHASNPDDGIKISNMYYTTPYKVVRIINN